MIVDQRESNILCATCGENSIRRTVEVRFPGKGGCDVSYDTHSRSLTENDWHAALNRLHAFHEKVFTLKAALNATARPELSKGTIENFDIDTVHPDACNRRTDIFVTAQVRAFGLTRVARIGPMPLEGLEVASVIEQMLPEAELAAGALRERFETGRF